MSQNTQQKLGKALWSTVEELHGPMKHGDLSPYMLALLCLHYLSDNYEHVAKMELGSEYPNVDGHDGRSPISVWYELNSQYQMEFEDKMRRTAHYVIHPQYLWSNIEYLARIENSDLLNILQEGFKYIETESFQNSFSGLFSEVNPTSDQLGNNYKECNAKLCTIISRISECIGQVSTDITTFGDAYEYLIRQFAARSITKASEFYTPQCISEIISEIVILDSKDPKNGKREYLPRVMDFACGSGSLLLRIRKHLGSHAIGRMYGQEINFTAYTIARMNMLIHGMKAIEFDLYHGDTLTNEWKMLRDMFPTKKPLFDAIVANPPFGYKWNPNESMARDIRFNNYGLPPKSFAEYLFLLHGLHYLKDDGVMAIVMLHAALFRRGSEAKIRRKLVEDRNIDTIISLPSRLFHLTGLPACIVVLKKCKKSDDILFINAAEHYVKGRRVNHLSDAHIQKIVSTYQNRPQSIDSYARRVGINEIIANDYNLNIARYVSTEVKIDLADNHETLMDVGKTIEESTEEHNLCLHELGLPPIGTPMAQTTVG